MSFHFLKSMKQRQNANQFAEDLLNVLKNGEIPKQEITKKERKNLSNGEIRQIYLYPESHSLTPPNQRRIIPLQFSRNKIWSERSFKYGMVLGEYLIPLNKDDVIETEKGKFIEFKHDFSGTRDDDLLIPIETISKLNPEIIEKNGLKYALIKVSDSNFEKLAKYQSVGSFLQKFKAFIKFHQGAKGEQETKRFKTFFREGNGAYNEKRFKKFIKENSEIMLRVIEAGLNKNASTGETLAREIGEKYSIRIPAKKTNNEFKTFGSMLRTTTNKSIAEMKEEIKKISEEREN